jgi:hypothetical protein
MIELDDDSDTVDLDAIKDALELSDSPPEQQD